MRKINYGILGLPVLLSLFLAFGATTEARAGVRVNVNIGPPRSWSLSPRKWS